MDARIPTIVKIAKQLNDKGVRYAVGGSVLLYLKGIDFNFNDLDLMIHEEDIAKVRETLSELGEYHPMTVHLTLRYLKNLPWTVLISMLSLD